MPKRKFSAITAGVILTALAVGLAVEIVVHFSQDRPGPSVAFSKESAPGTIKPKVLFVNSYHEGYPWSDGIVDGVLNVLKVHRLKDGTLDCSASPVTLSICYMDTKRNGSEQFKRQAGVKVKDIIESWKPDVVIGSDDNYTKYVIMPYYRGGKLPFVFCGVNWDASEYGLPCSNVTGMLEVCYIPKLLDAMRPYAHGTRVGLLGARNETNEKEAKFYAKSAAVKIEQVALVDTLEQWKTTYVDLQGKVDMLILLPPSFIQKPQDLAQARRFVLQNTRIPTGSVEEWIAPYSLICQAKMGSEQGEWAAKTAMQVLAGELPKDIPLAANHETRVILNMPLAKKLGIKFPINMIEQSTLIGEE